MIKDLFVNNFNIFSVGIVIVTIGILGFLVLWNNKRSVTNRGFFLFSLFTIFYSIANYISNDTLELWVIRLTIFIAVWHAFSIFHLFYVFPHIKLKLNKKYRYILVPLVAFVSLLTLTPLVFSNVAIVEGGDKVSDLIVGPGIALFGITVIGLVLASIYLIAKKTFRASGLEKNQFRFVLIGTIITFTLIIIFNLILPSFFNITAFVPLAPVFFLPFIIFTGYSIIRHHLFDVRVIITRSLVYSFLVLIISSIFTSATLLEARFVDQSNTTNVIITNIVAAIIVVLTLNPLRNVIAGLTDRIFFKQRVDTDKVAQELSDVIAETLERDTLLHQFAKRLKIDLKVHKVDILFSRKQDKQCTLYFSQGPRRKVSHDPEIMRHLWGEYEDIISFFIQYPKIKVREEEQRNLVDVPAGTYHNRLETALKDLDDRKIAIIVPVVSSPDEQAFLMIGNKISGDIFDSREMRLLDLIQSQLASALEKSRLYAEAQAFTVKLKKEVDDATTELKQGNKRLRELDKAKTLFLSVASHQLRTPLSGVKGYLSMILEGDYGKAPGEMEEVLKEVYANNNRLIRLVNTFLNVSRIEAGRLTITRQKQDVRPLATKVVSELQFNAKDKGLELVLEAPKEPVVANTDLDKLEDVLINLADNAIKYTNKGSVTVRVRDKGAAVRFEVQDTGQGLAKAEIGKLFNKFVRGNRALKVQPDGSGLGLYIAKRVVDMHGGKIGVESEGEGKGTLFWFEVPK